MMKYLIVSAFAFLFSAVMAYSQMFIPFTSEEGLDYAISEANIQLSGATRLTIVGHFLGELNLKYNNMPVDIESGFDLETGKANYWVYRFTNGIISTNIGVLNSPLSGGFTAMEVDISPYLNLEEMANVDSIIDTEKMMSSSELNQYFSNNSDFLTKFSNLTANYEKGFLGYFFNGPVSGLEQKLFWGFWLIKENGDADICVLDVDTKETDCITHTSIEEETQNSDISISPNPTSDVINICNTEFATEYTISNYYGEMILQGELIEGQNTLDISKLESGMYFVQLSNNSGMIKAEKIIVK